MDKPIWSRLFARQIAQKFGFIPANAPLGIDDLPVEADVTSIIEAMTESFRYLEPEQTREASAFADFLCARQPKDSTGLLARVRALEDLRTIRDFLSFLRERHGTPLPADEKDYWTEEDEREFTEYSIRRLEEWEAKEES